MAKHMTVTDCKSGKDFAQYVNHHPQAREIRQNGSHLCVKGPNPGTAVIPVHNGDMPGGTRRSVVKMLILIGLGLIPLTCLVIAYMAG
jgi:hypothetical protein